MYKPSFYNFFIDLEDTDNKLVYNTFTNRLGIMNPEYVNILSGSEAVNLNGIDHSIIKQLVKDGMLINEDIDEIKVLRYLNDSHKYSKEVMALTIVPTKNCNFRCTYCYQERDAFKDMSMEVQQEVLRFISSSVKKLKEIHITWFGGEPLLKKDIVVSMSRSIHELAIQNDCLCSFTLITNGYLIDDELIRAIAELNFQMVQLTLDGPPHIHNQRKGFKEADADCFERIIMNIKKLVSNNVKTAIRINIDHTNQDHLEELLDILVTENLKIPGIYAAQVYPYTEVCKSVEDIAMNSAEFCDYSYNLYELMLRKGFDVDISKAFPKRKAHFCCADQVNSFVVDPDGFLYKCYSDFEDSSSSLGSILDFKLSKIDKSKHAKWLTRSAFDSEECLDCKLLPLCMGGCPYISMKENKKNNCSFTEQYIQRIVKEYYKLVKLKEMCKSMAAQVCDT